MGGRGSAGGGGGGGEAEANARRGEGLYNRLRAGETLMMRSPISGQTFQVSAKHYGGATGYTVRQNGKIVPDYRGGKILPPSVAKEWLGSLKEVK